MFELSPAAMPSRSSVILPLYKFTIVHNFNHVFIGFMEITSIRETGMANYYHLQQVDFCYPLV